MSDAGDAAIVCGATEAPEAQLSARLITHAATERMIFTWSYKDLIGTFARLDYMGTQKFMLAGGKMKPCASGEC